VLGYRHAFHAGNFADVHKHAVLVQLLIGLARKDKPFCFIDTHAGAGCYDLGRGPAQKKREYEGGIGRIWDVPKPGPELAAYLDLVRALNPDGLLRRYPGSPRLARALLRPADRLILTERHPTDHAMLEAEFAGDRQVAVHFQDGYTAPESCMPPSQRRGLVLMDPAFELKGEFKRLLDAVQRINRRWATGTVAIWYPIGERTESERFHKALQGLGRPGILCAELGLYAYDNPRGLSGSGMVIVNPPWQLDLALRRLLPELLERLRVGDFGQTRVEWLVAAL
jgi:23S rRNA (adenine2030-N6)-methyltransferase